MTQPLRVILFLAVSTVPQADDDKESLPSQEADLRAKFNGDEYHIIDVLKIPGHSRKYYSFYEFAEAARKEEIDAPDRMIAHWKTRDFDVLACRDGSRFGREQSIFAEVVARTLDGGARLFTLQDGWIDEGNRHIYISMGGYAAASEVSRLVKGRKVGMRKRAQSGLPISSRIPISHKVIRDDKGKSIRIELNPHTAQLWQDVATLVLEGVSWYHVETELYQRYGHVNANGEAYHPNRMYRFLNMPVFWGHTAMNFRSPKSPIGFKNGQWIFDESAPVPDGITVFRNTHPAVYIGELAERIKSELMRRSDVVKGNATPHSTHRFTGLVLCQQCNTFMATHVDHNPNKNYRGLICKRATSNRFGKPCGSSKIVNEKKVIAFLDPMLRAMIARQTPHVFEDAADVANTQARLDALRLDIATLEEQARVLIREQMRAATSLQTFYRDELEKVDARLTLMRTTEAALEREIARVQHTTSSQTRGLKAIEDMGVDAFWQQDSRVINQLLHRVLGARRLVAVGGEIVGAVNSKKTQRNHT